MVVHNPQASIANLTLSLFQHVTARDGISFCGVERLRLVSKLPPTRKRLGDAEKMVSSVFPYDMMVRGAG